MLYRCPKSSNYKLTHAAILEGTHHGLWGIDAPAPITINTDKLLKSQRKKKSQIDVNE